MALGALGHAVTAIPWDAPDVDWPTYDIVVMRSTWNYHRVHERFLAWLAALEIARVRVINPVSLIRWNAHKQYLFDLETAGVAIPETVLIRRGDASAVRGALGGRRWTTAVVKPAISANAHRTDVLTADSPAAFEAKLSALAAHLDADVLAQELVSEIKAHGEYSMVFFDGAFSHAVLKRPAPGEFRVQEQFGGGNARVGVDRRLERAAHGVLEALPERPVYARLDLVPRGGGFLLMEVELIEPTLFLALDPQAPERFARAILAHVAAAR